MNSRAIIFIATAIVGLGIGLGLSLAGRSSEPAVAATQPPVTPTEPTTLSGIKKPSAIAEVKPVKTATADEHLAQIAKLKKLKDYTARYEALAPIFHGWARSDAEGAFEIWRETPEVIGMGFSYPMIARLHKEHGFPTLLDRVLTIEQPRLRTEALEQLALELYAATDKQAAAELLLEKAPQPERTKIVARAISSWRMKANIDKVWSWVESNQDKFEAEDLGELERAAARALISSYPDKGIKWLMARATDKTRSQHLACIASNWARQEPNATAKWLGTLPPGPQNDEALAAFAEQIVRDDPESAAHWAGTISDPEKRRQELAQAIAQWRNIDPAAAAKFEQAQVENSQQ